MERVTLQAVTEEGEPLEATYLPGSGMNMVSFKRGAIEAIDQSTRPLFEERYAGLGALIGPHFHRRNSATLPPIDSSLFPHIARLKEKGIDPFSHGIGRYAPWNYQTDGSSIHAFLSGDDKWNGIPLKELEGQQFSLEFKAQLTPRGLQIHYSVASSNESLVGLHYYYHLPQRKGTLHARVRPEAIAEGRLQPIPEGWGYESGRLSYNLDRESDFTFRPSPNPLNGEMLLDALSHKLRIAYSCACEENSWQLYHPAGASFVCIEPISSQDPRHANLTASSLTISLELLP